MSARGHHESYLEELRQRLRTVIYTRALAVTAAIILVVTCLVVWLMQRQGFPPALAWLGRTVLLVAIA